MFLSNLKFGVAAIVLFGVALAQSILIAGSPDSRPASQVRKPVVRNAPVPKEPAWKEEFRKAYGLKDGEVIRHVPLPFPKCRAEYFRDQKREVLKQSKLGAPAEYVDRDHTKYFTKFGWNDDWTAEGREESATPVHKEDGIRLFQVAQMTTGFTRTRTEGSTNALTYQVRGDFVVRVGADPEKVVSALEKILREECELKVSLAVREIEKDVYVLSGKYVSKPIAERKANQIEIYAVEAAIDRKTGNFGVGDLHAMAKKVEDFCLFPIVIENATEVPKSVEWHINYRLKGTSDVVLQDRKPADIMANLEAQTGLTAKLEKRKIKFLVVNMTD